MAYQTISSPKFYCDIFTLYSELGLGGYDGESNVFNLNPTSQYVSAGGAQHEFIYSFTEKMYNVHYIAILGHNLGIIDGVGGQFWQQFKIGTNPVYFDFQGTPNTHVNYPLGSNIGSYHGFSIRTFTDAGGDTDDDINNIRFFSDSAERDLSIGCISMGNVYEMVAPNLSLTMATEYNIKEFSTLNGSSMSNNLSGVSNPSWGKLGAWELADQAGSSYPVTMARSGRKTWKLKFTVTDTELWGSNQSLGIHSADDSGLDVYGPPVPDGDIYDSGDINDTWNTLNYNLISDPNFFSSVWSRTLGPTLKFIWQPNGNNSNPDGFYIAKFKNNSLKATQTSVNTHAISVIIEESF